MESDVYDEITKHYGCEFCKKTFAFVSQLNVHRRMHTGEKPFACDVCEKRYSRREHLNIHIRIHTQEKPYLCDLCDEAFSKHETLKRHRYEHLDMKDMKPGFECEFCHKTFQYKCLYENHRVVHTRRVRNHACPICSHRFFTLKNLQDHTRKIHAPDEPEPQICDICHSAFPTKYRLSRHRQQHNEKCKIYICELCGESLKSRTALVAHRRKHTGEKPYECDVCSQRFVTRKALKSHEISHIEVDIETFLKQSVELPHVDLFDNDGIYSKGLKCQVCDKKFSRIGKLKQHVNVHFSKMKLFPCAVCRKTYASSRTLKTHIRLHTGEKPYSCNVCEKKYYSSSSLAVHKKTKHEIKTFKCEICEVFFNTHRSLVKHITIHFK